MAAVCFRSEIHLRTVSGEVLDQTECKNTAGEEASHCKFGIYYFHIHHDDCKPGLVPPSSLKIKKI